MPNFSQVQLIGHLGREPETRSLQSGDTVTNFSLATNVKRNQDDITTWWNCSMFGKRGLTLAQYLRKGDAVHVWGEPTMRAYTAKDGTKQTTLEVRCDGFSFLGRSDGAQGASGGAGSTRQPSNAQNAPSGPPAAPEYDDDIPF